MIALAPSRALPRGLFGLAERLSRYRAQRAARRLVETLAARDDAFLDDIGLRRHELAAAWMMLDRDAGRALSGEAALRYLERAAADRCAAQG